MTVSFNSWQTTPESQYYPNHYSVDMYTQSPTSHALILYLKLEVSKAIKLVVFMKKIQTHCQYGEQIFMTICH
jgi:hypothetical protein